MNFIKSFNETIEIKDLGYLNELNAEITECYPNEGELTGTLYFTGNYHSSKTDEEKLISKDVEFKILFDNNKYELEDIECLNLKYQILEGVGVEVNFDIIINFNEMLIDERKEDQEVLIEEDIEIKKKLIEKVIDEKLSAKLDTRGDNLPKVVKSEVSPEDKSIVKVVYYNFDNELEKIAINNNKSLDTLFKENKNNNFNTHKRVIINHGK